MDKAHGHGHSWSSSRLVALLDRKSVGGLCGDVQDHFSPFTLSAKETLVREQVKQLDIQFFSLPPMF